MEGEAPDRELSAPTANDRRNYPGHPLAGDFFIPGTDLLRHGPCG